MLPWGKKALLSRAALLSPVFLLSAFNAAANPTGGQVAAGQATLKTQGPVLTVTNSPGAIINWQNFSIGAGERTNFVQQSASSAVLNRVVGQNVSAIFGALTSNGRVFLTNPNGVLFGAGAQVSTAAFTVSTTNISDGAFLSGNHGWSGSGSFLSIEGGTLSGPLSITNTAIDGGSLAISAGSTLTIIAPSVNLSGNSSQIVSTGTVLTSGNTITFGTLTNGSNGITGQTSITTQGGLLQTPGGNISLVGGTLTTTPVTSNVPVTTGNFTTSGPITLVSISNTGNSSSIASTLGTRGVQSTGGAISLVGGTLTTTALTSNVSVTTGNIRTAGTLTLLSNGQATGGISLAGATVTTASAPSSTVPAIVTNQPTPTISSNVAASGVVTTSASTSGIPNMGVPLAGGLKGVGVVHTATNGGGIGAATSTVALANAGATPSRPAVSAASIAAPVRSGAGVATINLQKREPLF